MLTGGTAAQRFKSPSRQTFSTLTRAPRLTELKMGTGELLGIKGDWYDNNDKTHQVHLKCVASTNLSSRLVVWTGSFILFTYIMSTAKPKCKNEMGGKLSRIGHAFRRNPGTITKKCRAVDSRKKAYAVVFIILFLLTLPVSLLLVLWSVCILFCLLVVVVFNRYNRHITHLLVK